MEPAELSPGDLELIAEATSWTGPTERCIDASERAFNGYLSRDERTSAARLALRLARGYQLLSAGSVAAGWVKRGERLLEDEPESVEHGHLARLRGVAASARGDLDEAHAQLRTALEIARRFADRDLEALTLHNQGSVLIGAGEVDEGWALIEESAATAAVGELRPTATGSVYCWTISTCRDLQEVPTSSDRRLWLRPSATRLGSTSSSGTTERFRGSSPTTVAKRSTTGDGFFVRFTAAGAALACAVAIQQALAEHRRHHGFAPPVRIGVHTAEALRVGRGYRGKGVHAAARIAAVATGNEVVATRDEADASGLRYRNPRTLELKGLSVPVEVVTIDWA